MAPDASPFHIGEQLVQQKVGTRAESEALGRAMIRPFMPEQHRAFFSNQVLLYVATQDAEGRTWASVLAGLPGVASSPDPTHLILATASHAPNDPINLQPGSQIGMLGLELHTRRRNRVNGTVVAKRSDGAAVVQVSQSFGNCPKYIQARAVAIDKGRLAAMASGEGQPPSETSGGTALGAAQRTLVAAADTFFLASSSGGVVGGSGTEDPRQAAAAGLDMSHRGGPPGFVVVSGGGLGSGTSLTWPDYAGNNQFNSLGNLLVNPSCGLLFIDFATGDTLQLVGRAEILFEERSLPGALRTLRFHVESWRHARKALPILPAPLLEASPYNPRPADVQKAGQQMVVCLAVRDEAEGIKTFEFQAPSSMLCCSGKPCFAPGQYASFDFDMFSETHNRTWTISCHPSHTATTGRFTISVKRKQGGLVSPMLHDKLRPGMLLAFRGVGGDFTPDIGSHRPALLIAGGIGITPLKAMLPEFVAAGIPATLLYSVRRPEEAAFLRELTALDSDASAAAAIPPGSNDSAPVYSVIATVTGKVEDSTWNGQRGRISADTIRAAAPTYAECDVYLCGPAAFMNSITEVLSAQLRHPRMDRVFTESFNF